MKSGGRCGDEDRLHLHWRLAKPARLDDGDLLKLTHARDLATRYVGADRSNKPVCHPIRWPGSYHRKFAFAPRLCEIAKLNPDAEIDIAAALAVLSTVVPDHKPKTPTPPAEWRDLARNGVAEGGRNTSVARLAGHLLRRRVDAEVVLELLLAWNAARNRPPLDDAEVTRTVNSIAGCELGRGVQQ